MRTFGRVLEAAVGDGLQQLGLEHQLLEARSMDAHIAFLLRAGLASGRLGLLHLLLLAASGAQHEQRVRNSIDDLACCSSSGGWARPSARCTH